MPDLSRRSLAAGSGLLLGALAVPATAQLQIATANAAKVRAQPLTFNPEKIKWLSPRLIASHYEEYASAVGRLNALTEQLAQLDFAATPPVAIGELKREQHLAFNSTLFHELYFECLGDVPTQPGGVFAQALSRDFGSLDRWRAEFTATSKALAGGSGLVILAYASRDKRLIIHAAADYGMAPAAGVPLLVLDMYDHAYRADYGSDPARYVDTFMQMIRWITAERLYREALRV